MPLKTNIVSKEKLREVQLNTLKIISDTISKSFGPMGSNTLILKDGSLTKYSKDGFTILKEMKFLGVIEESVRQDIEDILRNIVNEFGDNSTSAAILSYLLFDALCKLEKDNQLLPYDIIRNFKAAVKDINEEIMDSAIPCRPVDIYNITYTSTNGNEELSNVMRDIYTKYGMDVYIDVSTSNTEDFIIKELDGLTLNTGYMDTCFINNKAKNISSIHNANIYYFEDPIDTPELASLFDSIIGQNIIGPIRSGKIEDMKPTVILCPMLSKDYSSTVEQIVNFMHQNDINNRPPLLIVTNIYDKSVVSDIIHICGCPIIKKYLDPKNQKADIEKGLAPDPITITSFCGHAELVESTYTTTKFINPSKMYISDEEGNRVESPEFKALITFLENEINREYETGNKSAGNIAVLRKRLNALKSNSIELYVGGISPAERDSAKDLIEDAILNCRSAAKYGYGYGANYEGLRASSRCVYKAKLSGDPLLPYFDIIFEAYKTISIMLYSTVYDKDTALLYVISSSDPENGCPLDLRTGTFNKLVLSSIRSDVAVLDAISRIMTIMVTSNQALLQNPVVNNYEV